MKLGIVHITDLHVSLDDEQTIKSRFKALTSYIQGVAARLDQITWAITGDIPLQMFTFVLRRTSHYRKLTKQIGMLPAKASS
jgi:hypothetical protein